MEVDKAKSFIKQVTNDLEDYLLNLCDEDQINQKKAELVTYWIKDYIKYLKFEEKFTPKKMKIYSRGDIIKVNFGFNLGNEEGGLHYAVVLDNNNAQSSGVITVVPLCSLKPNEAISKYDVSLGNELYNLMKNKFEDYSNMYNSNIKRISIEIEECKKENELHTSITNLANCTKNNNGELVDLLKQSKQNINNKIDRLRLQIEECENRLKYIKRIKREFDKMNLGSKALVGQITTVSKMRIFDPKQKDDILAGIRVSPNQLDKITEKIKELYIYSVDKKQNIEYTILSDENNAV